MSEADLLSASLALSSDIDDFICCSSQLQVQAKNVAMTKPGTQKIQQVAKGCS